MGSCACGLSEDRASNPDAYLLVACCPAETRRVFEQALTKANGSQANLYAT